MAVRDDYVCVTYGALRICWKPDEAVRVALELLRKCGVDLDAEVLERAAESLDESITFRRIASDLRHKRGESDAATD